MPRFSLAALPLILLATACQEKVDDHLWAPAAQDERNTGTALVTQWPRSVAEVRFGVTPYLDRPAMEAAFRPVLEHLSEHIGVPFRLIIADDYSDLGKRVRAQELDLAKFSPLSYVEAKNADPGLQLILMQVAGGGTSYLGYVYTLSGDPAESLLDLSGRSFCYVDPHSTSGYLYPRALMLSQGIDPDRFLGHIEYGGNHVACIRKVLDGELDAGAGYSGAFGAARQQGLPVYKLKILAKTVRIPYDAYCVRSGLPLDATRRLKQELLGLSTRSPGGRRLLAGAVKFNAWTAAEDSDYDSIREALALTRRASRGKEE